MAQAVARGFVLADELELSVYGAGYLVISGQIRCLGDILIDVDKVLKVVDGTGESTRIQTAWYRYNARIPGRGIVVRYDAPHPHRPVHHAHRFNILEASPVEQIEESPDGDWPVLGEVIQELEHWYYEHYDALSS